MALTESTSTEVLQLISEEKITRALFAPAQREAILLVNEQFESNFISSEYFRHLQSELSAVSARINFLFEPVSSTIDDEVDFEASDSGNVGGGQESTHNSRLSTLWK